MSATTMFHVAILVLAIRYSATVGASVQSQFSKQGDYLLGGLFKLHDGHGCRSERPEVLDYDKFPFTPASFKRMQAMRFAIEEINNSTHLLPGIILGYEIFDYCSDVGSLALGTAFLACGASIPTGKNHSCHPRILSVTGPFGSTETISVSQLFLFNLLPVVTHGATSVQLSNRQRFPSFFRTSPSDKFQVQAIVHILKDFRWNWVAFLGGDTDYSRDALAVFEKEVESAGICLAHRGLISVSNYSQNLRQLSIINQQKIEVVVLFAHIEHVKFFMKTVVEQKVQKIWIGSETWSMSTELLKNVTQLGTVLGVTLQQIGPLNGFNEFIHKALALKSASSSNPERKCGQRCEECLSVNANTIIEQDSTFSFSIYSAVYAVANALHEILPCNSSTCPKSTVEPHMLIRALDKVKFDLYNRSVEFDEKGDPPAFYNIVFWDWTLAPPTFAMVGSFHSIPVPSFYLNRSRLRWHTGQNAPKLRCSPECKLGYRRVQTSFHACCFDCVICSEGTYINRTADPSSCIPCEENEWSINGSVTCHKRTLVFLAHGKPVSVLLIMAASLVIVLSGCAFMLFLCHYGSPVVKSAGGKMSLLVLVFLALSSISVFLFCGRPSVATCTLRLPTFLVFYSATLSCLAVRSFQIVSVFKMAAKLPRAYEFWVKHSGQWLIVGLCALSQVLLSTLWMAMSNPTPYRIHVGKETILFCTLGEGKYHFLSVMFALVGLLSLACFVFGYLGMDLPKNYNEGKAVTFSLLVFYISWAVYLTLYFVLDRNSVEVVNAFSILCSIYGVLLGYFGPKCHIIICQPERNTTAHFQATIQNYNLQPR